VRQRLGRIAAADARGFTLVELITTMTILMIVLTGITSLFVAGTRSQSDQSRRFQAQTQLRVGLDRLRKDIHSACRALDTSTGQVLTEGATPTSVSFYMPPSCAAANSLTWCTQGSGNRYALYRASGMSCAGGIKYADFLTTGSVFTFHTYNQPAGSYTLARLHVNMPDNVKGSGLGTYRLADDIVFRNSPRCTIGTDCP
jgi:prepilin-type N-terminal cleavage/methylation domain-containing protein